MGRRLTAGQKLQVTLIRGIVSGTAGVFPIARAIRRWRKLRIEEVGGFTQSGCVARLASHRNRLIYNA
jgi:hypothetical protein